MKSREGGPFQEYWGTVPRPEDRIPEWIHRADGFAEGWRPSDHLFRAEQAKT